MTEMLARRNILMTAPGGMRSGCMWCCFSVRMAQPSSTRVAFPVALASRLLVCLLLAAGATPGCARPPEPPAPPPRAAAPAGAPRPTPPTWSYYEPIDARVAANVHGPDLPLDDVQIAKIDGA